MFIALKSLIATVVVALGSIESKSAGDRILLGGLQQMKSRILSFPKLRDIVISFMLVRLLSGVCAWGIVDLMKIVVPPPCMMRSVQ